MPLFEEIVPSPDLLVGVKAIWGPISARIQCFGSRGDRNRDPDRHFMIPRSVAERSLKQEKPFLITIGGGQLVEPAVDGRVVELMRLSGVYGDTRAFVHDDELLSRLAQWPVAIAVHDVYDVVGWPLLVEDLQLADRSILNAAFDNVVRPKEQVEALWEALRGRELELRDLDPIPGFRDPGTVCLVSTHLPRKVSAEEGRRIRKESIELERRGLLAAEAKRHNAQRHGGRHVCEACGFSDELAALFDAHHLVPLALGQRITVVTDFSVLCPTCHRIAHQKALNRNEPLTVLQIKGVLGR